MDELEISGKRYISSRRAGKEHKYHPDYIGQLVRAGKVAGQKVGRSWYVDAESLAEYLGKETPPRGPMPKIESVPVQEATVVRRMSVAERVAPQEAEAAISEPEEEVTEEIEEEEAQHIPVKISYPKVNPILHSPRQGLRYVADNEPLFPAIHRQSKTMTEEVMEHEEAPLTLIQRPPVKRRAAGALLLLRIGTLVILGAVALLLTAGGAYYLAYVQTSNGTSLTASVAPAQK